MGLHEQQADPETQPDHPSKLSLASPQRLVYCLSYILLSELICPSLRVCSLTKSVTYYGSLKVALPRVQRA